MRSISTTPIFSLLAVVLVHACGTTQQDVSPGAATSASHPSGELAPALPEAPPIPEKLLALYRKALPQAVEFIPKRIPTEMIRSLDQGNDTYAVARDGAGQVVGYVRTFSGPLTLDAACECQPLAATFVFNPDRSLYTILSPAPLTKKDHLPLSEEDMASLVAIARAPDAALLKSRQADTLLDATTGATKTEAQGLVVPQAALTTHRVVGIVRETQRIIDEAPAAWDKRRLIAILEAAGDDVRARALALASFIPTAENEDVAVEAYRIMASSYLQASRGQATDKTAIAPAPLEQALPEVEARIIAPGIAPGIDPHLAVDACYQFANLGLRLDMAQGCLRQLPEGRVHPALADRLAGTIHYQRRDVAQAIHGLESATSAIDAHRDPTLHQRYGLALLGVERREEACAVGKSLFITHPLLPAMNELLAACQGDVQALKHELYAEMRSRILGQVRRPSDPAPVLPLEDDQMRAVDVPLFEPGKVTVAVFFATWCPHCQTELPRVVEFVRHLRTQGLEERVRVLGVRTAVEKETERYADFVKRLQPNFPIWTDPVMSLGFSKFANSQGLTPGIPTVAVINDQGQVRYVFGGGDYRDVVRELDWAVREILESAS